MRDIEVTATTEINAPAAAIWDVLTDLEQFRDWNPFIREARGSTALGGTVRVRVHSSLPLRLAFHATVIEHDEPRSLRWQGHTLANWIGFGDHTFDIDPLDGGRCRFVQRERFSGLLPRLAARLLTREAQRGFNAMNRALKERVEHVNRRVPHATTG